MAWEVWVSLTDFSSHSTGAAAFVGLANYARLAQDVDFWSALLTTVLYFAVTTAAKLVLGVALALLLARLGRGRRSLVFLAVFLPWAYPGGVSVIGWYWMLNPPIADLLQYVHGRDQVRGGRRARHRRLGLHVRRALQYLAGLVVHRDLPARRDQRDPDRAVQYAQLETRSAWQRLHAVTLPLLRPYMALAVFLSFTTAFADLANVWMLTGGRIVFPVLGTQAYWLGIKAGQFAEGAARSLSLVPLLVLAILLLFHWFDRREEEDRAA